MGLIEENKELASELPEKSTGKKKVVCKVYLNGKYLGKVSDGEAYANEIRQNRRQGLLSGEINVVYKHSTKEVDIFSDRGRVRKPYIIVENGKSKFTEDIKTKLANKEIDFNYLIRRGIIEYLDADEEENALVALSPEDITNETTHLEIDPASNLSLIINASVFPEYNSIGKHSLVSNFIKQSQGLYALNFKNRYDARAFLLYYPQMPIVNSITYRKLNMYKHASGQNFVVALQTYYGYNMSDAVVLNKAAIDRGLGRSVFYRSYGDEERKYPGGQKDHFRIPPPTAEGYRGEQPYSKLGEDGIVEPETELSEGEVVIGKVSPPRFLEEQTAFGVAEEKVRDNSVSLRAGEDGIVDSVMISETTSATRLIKVRLRSCLKPENGDKFGSRSAQKGVVGLIVNQADMPFTSSGIVPDLLLNPHSLPGRMTVGHMLEMLVGKTGSIEGKYFDGTPFSTKGQELIDYCKAVLEKNGFDGFGDEWLYDGRTGKKFNAQIFTGVVYYNRLMQMVNWKIQVRGRGPVQILTHQPTEGKPRKGGLKFGEMERDALIGHGASLLVKDRMLEQSDKTTVWICNDCGDIGYFDYIKNIPICQTCGSNSLRPVEISYAFKVLLDEIKAMHMLPRIQFKK
ncbi:MAG: hypothetical protein QXD11_00490 [Candidatus Micrarchaeaceae archaeon]